MQSGEAPGSSNRINRIPVVMGVELHIAAKKVWGNILFFQCGSRSGPSVDSWKWSGYSL